MVVIICANITADHLVVIAIVVILITSSPSFQGLDAMSGSINQN
jgi:general stress protein CsbA